MSTEESINFVILVIIGIGLLFGITKTLKDGNINKLKLLVIAVYVGIIGTIVVSVTDMMSLVNGTILTVFFMSVFVLSASVPFLAYRFHEILKPTPKLTSENNFEKWN